MGYIKHGAAIFVITTSNEDDFINKYNEWRIKNNAKYFTEAKVVVNNYISFAKLPDGSKEGWKESDNADKSVKDCIDFLDNYDDKIWYSILITRFGGDNDEILTDYIKGR